MSPWLFVVPGAIVVLLMILALSAIRVVQQYERGIIFVSVSEPLKGSRLQEPALPLS